MDEYGAAARGRAPTLEFFAAVESADTARVRELLACDPALVRARDDEGATALHHAAERGHRGVVTLLLDAEEIARLFREIGDRPRPLRGDESA